ncbi:hypothetical protein DHEL01_v213120 [Diaporthe helianthi]|uniref:Uncharacterized protein n=1 Tax=Diaporthe helianthi TaxID=158607 RepID=A0A2P5HE02_DIAHE|nr:hypothetical protein DHEL01_v213120 [Diaporthe helianthi]
MGFLQIGFEVNRLAPNPDKPNQELAAPALFRPANLLFGPKNMVSDNKKMMTDEHEAGAAASARAGPWSVQAGTAFSSDHVAMHQLLSAVYIGATIGVIRSVLETALSLSWSSARA